jgi:hypothetical protein
VGAQRRHDVNELCSDEWLSKTATVSLPVVINEDARRLPVP